MKVLLFEDEAEWAKIITTRLLKKLPDIEILWFGGIEGHKQPPIPHPFAGSGECILRAKCQVVTKSGTCEMDVDVLPGDLSGAILDIYVGVVKVGENIARWLQYAEFSGPVLLCSAYDLPPVFPALPMIFACKKQPPSRLESQVDTFCAMLPCSGARVNSRGMPTGGAERLMALRWKQIVWDWLPVNADMSQVSSILGPGVHVEHESFAVNPLLARDVQVKDLCAFRERTRNPNLFYLMIERESLGVAPFDALKAGIVYLPPRYRRWVTLSSSLPAMR